MARRVGFGGSGEKRDEKRPPKRAPKPPRTKTTRPVVPDSGVADTAPSVAGRLLVGGFLLLWLTLWSAGIVFAALTLFSEWGDGETFASGFLLLWLVFALIGWWVAVKMLLGVVRGDPGVTKRMGKMRTTRSLRPRWPGNRR